MSFVFDLKAFQKAMPPKKEAAPSAPPKKPASPPASPAKPKKTLKQELAEMGDFDQIQKEADNIPQDLLDLLKAPETAGEEEEAGEQEEAPAADAKQPPLPMPPAPAAKEGKKPSGSLEAAAPPSAEMRKALVTEEVTKTLDLFRGTDFHAEALEILSRMTQRCAEKERLYAKRRALWALQDDRACDWNKYGFQTKDDCSRELDDLDKKCDKLYSEQAEDEAALYELQAKLFKQGADRITRDKLSKGIEDLRKAVNYEGKPADLKTACKDDKKKPIEKAPPSAMPEPDPEEVKEKQAEEAEKKAEEEEDEDDEKDE